MRGQSPAPQGIPANPKHRRPEPAAITINAMWRRIVDFFRPSSRSSPIGQAHMTFAAASVGRSISRTSLFVKKQLWIWPIFAVALLALIGWAVGWQIEQTIEENLESELNTLVGVERAMLETWLALQESNAESLANDQQVRRTAAKLLQDQPLYGADISDEQPPATGGSAPSADHADLARELGPGMTSHRFANFILADKSQRIVASSNIELLGKTIPQYETFLAGALDGRTTVSPPFPSVTMMKDDRGRTMTGVPTMFVCAPIRDDSFQVIGALGLRIRPEREFTRILQLGRTGKSGETYAVDKNGLMVSSSRFDESLILLGILPDTEDAQSILNVAVRDPGGDMTRGYRPGVRRSELPLTRSAAAVVAGTSGSDVEGYRDYRGVRTVGAWQWLDKYGIGVITELDYDEGFRPLMILRRAFYALLVLLALCSAAIFVFTLIVARLQREARKAAIEARQLGQYRLETRLGAGAMGVVYKGCHAMLRRPTAIKMLNVDRVNEMSVQRFEREVQITCKLNHPNTVAIYDYGRTPEGVFYYAMEYLDGIDLQALVENYGPQSEARVIRILQQICGSLYEAHSLGLVHRDIKPANIMLNRRGGEPDVVKVLDFGLVKALDDDRQDRASQSLSGTPLYMSPEAIQSPETVDARSDLYAVGGVGYFLLTGQTVFSAATLAELCRQHVTAVPQAPSERLGRAVSSELESALLACLEKNRSRRPQTARDLANMLSRAAAATEWSVEEADAWWGRHERTRAAETAATAASGEVNTATGGATNGAGARSAASSGSRPPAASASAASTAALDRTIAHDKNRPL